MPYYNDWHTCRDLWSRHMQIECASVGYDFDAGRKAESAYTEACVAFKKEYGFAFDPRKEYDPTATMGAFGAALFNCFKPADQERQIEALAALRKLPNPEGGKGPRASELAKRAMEE